MQRGAVNLGQVDAMLGERATLLELFWMFMCFRCFVCFISSRCCLAGVQRYAECMRQMNAVLVGKWSPGGGNIYGMFLMTGLCTALRFQSAIREWACVLGR
jgi:hypothetical protein